MTERQERIADLYYASNSVQFGAFELSIHKDRPELRLSPWYLHYPKQDEAGVEYLPDLYDLIGEEFYEISEANIPGFVPARIAGLPKGALPLGEALAKHYSTYPSNLLTFEKIQHADGRTEFEIKESIYKWGDFLQPCEDHVSGARNNLIFLKAVRKMGFEVTRLLAVVDRQQGGVANLKNHGVEMLPILTGDQLLNHGLTAGYISLSVFEEVQEYRTANQYSLVGLKKWG